MKINYYYLGMLRDSFVLSLIMSCLLAVLTFFFYNPDVFIFYVILFFVVKKADNSWDRRFSNLMLILFVGVNIGVLIMSIFTLIANFMFLINCTLLIFLYFFIKSIWINRGLL